MTLLVLFSSWDPYPFKKSLRHAFQLGALQKSGMYKQPFLDQPDFVLFIFPCSCFHSSFFSLSLLLEIYISNKSHLKRMSAKATVSI